MNRHSEVIGRLAKARLDKVIMIEWLDQIGYFTAPSSTKYHDAYEGGNCDHSLAVCDKLVWLTDKLSLEWDLERSPYVIGLFHDLCKCDAYVRDEISCQWEHNSEMDLAGHGDKSAMILSTVLQLTEEELLCIRYHMGAYETDDWTGFDRAIRKYPNVLYTHTADMLASKLEV